MSDDVSQFLQQVEELKGRRQEEDEARTRDLEEKILQEKRERQARRAERARSISPQKSSPASTPPPNSYRNAAPISGGLKLPSSPIGDTSMSPQPPGTNSPDAMDFYSSPSKENESPFDYSPKRTSMASPSNAAPSGRPLSWQRRPNSEASDRPRSRPLSVVAAENAAARSTPVPSESPTPSHQTLSRDQIAQALSSKDPAWFRQTAERGLNSAAYRKNQVEDEDRLDMLSVRAELPGMSRETNNTSPRSSITRLDSPMELRGAQRLDPPIVDGYGDPDQSSIERPGTMSLGSGRASPTRPLSPTKGMGGFVQSAMMKRSDSVKRWNVTSPFGLARADSVATNRNTYDRTASPQPISRPASGIRDGSTTPTSRPTSRGATNDNRTETHATTKAAVADPTPEMDTTPAPAKSDEDKVTPPSSPSKTMDPRRWSPTKASWLETALNKPESPKPKPTPPPSNQPAWMVELNKSKAQKASNPNVEPVRSGSVPSKHEVSIGGLMRSSPMGAATKPAVSGLGGAYSPTATGGSRTSTGSVRSGLSKSVSSPEPIESTMATGGAPSATAAGAKPKPETPPKKDFRANLKPSNVNDNQPKEQVNEFQNVFGNLRRTKTQNYVAPDTFKDNIVKGKAALNITGGPKKSDRKDEFKEAILQKKAEFKQTQRAGQGVTTNAAKNFEKPVPEGLARRAELGRSTAANKRDSASSTAGTPTRADAPSLGQKRESRETVPENNARKDSLTLQKESGTPARLQNRAGGSSLADRFNPGLAGLLARGPPGMATDSGRGSGDSDSSAVPGLGDAGEKAEPGPQLTHMTKGRARGPRRRAPASATPSAGSEPSTPMLEETQAAPPSPGSKQKSVPLPAQVEEVTDEDAPSSPKTVGAQVAAKAAALRNRSPSPAKPADEGKLESQPPSPRKLDMKRRSAFLDGAPNLPSPKVEPVKRSPSPTAPKKFDIGTFDLGSFDKVNSEPVVTVKNATSMFGGAASGPMRSPPKESNPSMDQPPAQLGRSKSPARSPTRSNRPLPLAPSPGRDSPTPTASPMRSPTKQTMEVSALLEDFFGVDKPKRDYRTDTAEILMNRPQTGPQVKSLGAHLFQFFEDGKKLPVPASYERILFEREMYICPHHFTNTAGRKVCEVYFWAGDEVPESVVEDAEVFVQREAKALGGRLVKLRQGKESPEFVQALGGILITRRGSSKKYDSLAPNMLCGRRYLGQVAFDEVDFTPASLCSGFPYLITQQGKCYLWKGKGSDMDELGCARLVGMDLTLTGELVEVDDGSEAANFWDIFDGGSKPHSADHWRLKPNYEMYSGRLFCSNAAASKQIVEISPFSQADLRPTNIYILDAFFEMYIIVGAQAQSQYLAFRNALDFAQEYAILASGMEDRPFVPISTVVLEGIPRDLKSVFRKWRDSASPTVMNQAGTNLKRGRSLRVVPLTHALQALSE